MKKIDQSTKSFYYTHQKAFEIIFICGLVLIAIFLRVYNLEKIPPGLHGDEAFMGLKAKSLLNDISAGTINNWQSYTSDPLGAPLPAGTFATALFFYLFKSNVYYLRLSAAVFGVLCILFVYLASKELFNKQTAIFTSLIATFSYWHIHYSRIAFPVIFVPLIASASVYFLLKAIRTNKKSYFILAGITAGVGLYTYAVYALFIVPFMIFAAYNLLINRKRWIGFLAFFVLFTITAGPFLQDSIKQMGVTNRLHGDSIFYQQSYTQLGPSEKVEFLLKRAITSPLLFFQKYRVDMSDGMGILPPLDIITSILFLIGVGVSIRNIKNPKIFFLLILILFSLAGLVLTEDGRGFYRRTITGWLPVMIVSGIGLNFIYSSSQIKWKIVPIVLLLLFMGFLNAHLFFNVFPETQEMQTVFAHGFVEAFNHIAYQEPNRKIYWYSDVMPWGHEDRRFLIPDADGEDRSRKFGTFSLEKLHDKVMYVFMPGYSELVENVTKMHPDGSYNEFNESGRMLFSTYQFG